MSTELSKVKPDVKDEAVINPAKPGSNLPKSVGKGEKQVEFQDNREWDKDHHTKLGHSTKKLSFGSGFVLTSAHIDELLSFGPRLCSSLVHFQFKYENVSYNAKNEAKVTTDDLIRLAKACTNFRFVQLQGISASVSDYGVQAFFQNCPDLTHLEISGSSRGANVKLDGTCLAMLREHTDWVPKLKTLRLDDKDNRVGFMKAMRTLSKERIKLLIQLVSVSECKKWGDWELEVYHQDYRKGRKCSRF